MGALLHCFSPQYRSGSELRPAPACVGLVDDLSALVSAVAPWTPCQLHQEEGPWKLCHFAFSPSRSLQQPVSRICLTLSLGSDPVCHQGLYLFVSSCRVSPDMALTQLHLRHNGTLMCPRIETCWLAFCNAGLHTRA